MSNMMYFVMYKDRRGFDFWRQVEGDTSFRPKEHRSKAEAEFTMLEHKAAHPAVSNDYRVVYAYSYLAFDAWHDESDFDDDDEQYPNDYVPEAVVGTYDRGIVT